LRGSRELVLRCTLTEKTLIKFWLGRLFIPQTHSMISIKVSWLSNSRPERPVARSSRRAPKAQYSTPRTSTLTLSAEKLTCALLKRDLTPYWPNKQSSTTINCSKEAPEEGEKTMLSLNQAARTWAAPSATCRPPRPATSPPVPLAPTTPNNTSNVLAINRARREAPLLTSLARGRRPHVALDG